MDMTGRWISVNECMPPINRNVMISDGKNFDHALFDGNAGWIRSREIYDWQVKAWFMPPKLDIPLSDMKD